jgi:kynurenine 3-monooxygenase
MKKVTLIGAGPAGSLLAILLARRGFQVEIFERRPDMRKVKISAGRSINLAISARGIHALQEAKLWEAIHKISVPMRGRMMHSAQGELVFQPYGKDETEVIYAASRAELNKALMTEAEKESNVRIHFSERCVGMDFKTGEVRLRHEDTQTERAIQTETVIGTDGSASAIRTDMLKLSRFNFSQEYLEHGYKELTIPPGPDGSFQIDPNALHIWPRKSFMLIALPNFDGSFGCIFFLPFEGQRSFAMLHDEKAVFEFFEQEFPDALTLMPCVTNEFFENPTGSMVTVRCYPWHVGEKALLIGDAAHAIVPFFGQGVNCAFEGCMQLTELVDRYKTDWQKIFSEFERARKTNTDAIADLALENFIEMRDRVADPKFLFRKKVEQALEKKFPNHFVPKYSMVTFHKMPYSLALSRGRIQDRILSELCQSLERLDDLDWAKAERLIKTELISLSTAHS